VINVTNVWTLAGVLRHKLSEPLMKMIELIRMMESECANVGFGRVKFISEPQKALLCPVGAEDW